MRKRLIELLNQVANDVSKFPTDNFIGSLADYLIANGVIVQFPKVGKKIYIHQFDNKMQKVVVECKIIKQNNAEELFKVKLADGRRLTLLYQFVGKTVFLTKEDAERALKGVTDKLVGGNEKGGVE